jgi:hypothetical protein
VGRSAVNPPQATPDALRPERDEAYSALEGGDALPVLSLVCFAVALSARPLTRLLPPELRPYPRGVLVPVLIALAASLLGTLIAGWSLRSPRRRGAARGAQQLNRVVLPLTALAILVMLWIFRR